MINQVEQLDVEKKSICGVLFNGNWTKFSSKSLKFKQKNACVSADCDFKKNFSKLQKVDTCYI